MIYLTGKELLGNDGSKSSQEMTFTVDDNGSGRDGGHLL